MASGLTQLPVLVVDDDVGTIETFRSSLVSTGYRVRTAVAVSEGCTIAQAERCGLILSDLRLPDRSGIDFLAHLRSVGNATPFVLFTGYASIHSAVDAVRGGACDYLEKPVDIDQLCEVVRTWFRAPDDIANSIDSRVQHVRTRIERDPAKAVRLELVAGELGISESRLRHLFRRQTGQSVRQFQQRCQLEAAATALTLSFKRISEIAYECGFDTLATFDRRFRKRFRVSPSEFRARDRVRQRE